MQKVIKALILMIAALVLVGCSAKGPQFNGFKRATANSSNVYIYRTSYLGGAVVPDIHQTNLATKSDKVLGGIKPNGYIVSTVTPGSYKFWAKTEAQNEVNLQVEPNQNYCIKHYISLGILVGHPQFEKVDMQTCQNEIKHTHLSK